MAVEQSLGVQPEPTDVVRLIGVPPPIKAIHIPSNNLFRRFDIFWYSLPFAYRRLATACCIILAKSRSGAAPRSHDLDTDVFLRRSNHQSLSSRSGVLSRLK